MQHFLSQSIKYFIILAHLLSSCTSPERVMKADKTNSVVSNESLIQFARSMALPAHLVGLGLSRKLFVQTCIVS